MLAESSLLRRATRGKSHQLLPTYIWSKWQMDDVISHCLARAKTRLFVSGVDLELGRAGWRWDGHERLLLKKIKRNSRMMQGLEKDH